LASFSIDRDKINFFSKAQGIVSRMQKSEKVRLKLIREKLDSKLLKQNEKMQYVKEAKRAI
jgi:hypothetical protein